MSEERNTKKSKKTYNCLHLTLIMGIIGLALSPPPGPVILQTIEHASTNLLWITEAIFDENNIMMGGNKIGGIAPRGYIMSINWGSNTYVNEAGFSRLGKEIYIGSVSSTNNLHYRYKNDEEFNTKANFLT